MVIHLGRPLPDASCDTPGRRRENPPVALNPPVVPTRSCSRWGLPCRPRHRERGALLPHPFTLTLRRTRRRRAVYFLWHFPWGRPRRPLTGTVFPWSPDFPRSLKRTATIRPSGFLLSHEGEQAVKQTRRFRIDLAGDPCRPETPLKGFQCFAKIDRLVAKCGEQVGDLLLVEF